MKTLSEQVTAKMKSNDIYEEVMLALDDIELNIEQLPTPVFEARENRSTRE